MAFDIDKVKEAASKRADYGEHYEIPDGAFEALITPGVLIRPLEQRFYQHYKGGLYYVHGIATHTETGEEIVVYRHVGGKLYARPLAEWCKTAYKPYPPPCHRGMHPVNRFSLLPEDFKLYP